MVLHDVTLNLHDISRKSSYATKVVLDAAVGKKYFNYIGEIFNIGAIEINQDTRSNAANLFSALSVTWANLPAQSDMDWYRKVYTKHYNKECICLFDIFYQSQSKLLGEEIKRYFFVEAKTLNSIYYLSDIENNVEKLYFHFMEHNDEMLYILGADGKVYGIVSRGDLYRYYENQMNRLNINQKFQAISSQDYIAAEEIFQKIDTIHEVPVVNNGELMGVIRYKTTKNRNDWEVYKRRLARIRERFLS